MDTPAPRGCGLFCLKVSARRHGNLVTSMCRRKHTSALTDDNLRVFCALSAKDLQLTGSSREAVVNLLGTLFSD